MTSITSKLKQLLDNMTQEEFDYKWNTIAEMGLEGPEVNQVIDNVNTNDNFEKLKYFLDSSSKEEIINILEKINFNYNVEEEIIFDEEITEKVVKYLDNLNYFKLSNQYCHFNLTENNDIELVSKKFVEINSVLSESISEYLNFNILSDFFSHSAKLSNTEELTNNTPEDYAFAA